VGALVATPQGCGGEECDAALEADANGTSHDAATTAVITMRNFTQSSWPASAGARLQGSNNRSSGRDVRSKWSVVGNLTE
jgi:hypothetical protein